MENSNFEDKNIKVLHLLSDSYGGIYQVVQNLLLCFPCSKSLNFLNYRGNIFQKLILFRKDYLLMKENFDIIHFHGAWYFHVFLLFIKTKKPLIISPHGAFHLNALKKSRFKKALVKIFYMKRLFSKAKCIIALSKDEEEDIKKFGLKNQIYIVPNFIKIQNTKIQKTEKQKEIEKFIQNKRVFLFMSRLHKAKGIEILIDAFCEFNKKNKNFILIIAGDEKSAYMEFLIKKIQNLNLTNSVFLVGYLDNNDKMYAYKTSDVFILPSFNEGMSLSVFEAYFYKKPTITTTQTPFSFIEKDNIGWICNPKVDELFLKLMSVAKLDNQVLQDMGNRGYEVFKDKFSLENTIIKLQKIYYESIKK